MPASGDISFELERFEWASPDRLEVEGRWHGVRRRLARATLVVEVDGQRRRLKALPNVDAGSPERWVAAFPWEGEMPKLPGAELEVGRGIVVDLPRPRRSKARGAAITPAEPIPATSREEREATPVGDEAERLLAAARADADEAAARAAAAEAEATVLRERAEAAETEIEAERGRASTAEAELETVRERAETAEAELEALRSRSEDVESELAALEARAEAAEAEVTALRSGGGGEADIEPAFAPDLERLRTELQTVERERSVLRAQHDATVERLEAVERSTPKAAAANTSHRTQAMPGPRTLAAGGPRFGHPGDDDAAAEDAEPRRRTRRPAERTARRSAETPEPSAAESGPPLGERISDWMASLTGSRAESQNGGAETEPTAQRAERTRPAQAGGAAVRTRRRTDRRVPGADDGPSWPLRVAAVGLLALLMVALFVIVLSLL
jgi:predicted  nucleic acid-binding Zn-ribbon protein